MAQPKSTGRMIRKRISRSKKFASLSKEAMVLFCLIISHLNSHGKANGSPYFIKGEIVPLIEWFTVPLIEECLREISDKTNLKWFEVDGLYFLHSTSWARHQDIREEKTGNDDMPSFAGNTGHEVREKSGSSPELGRYEVEVEVKEESKKAYATSDGKAPSDIAPPDAARGSKKSDTRESDAAKGGSTSERERVFEEEFWPLYPARDGKKLLKKDAKRFFLTKIKDVEVSLVLQAARNYSVSKTATDGFAKDAIRFLQKDYWRDWLEPEVRHEPGQDPEWERKKREIEKRLQRRAA